MSLFGGGGKGLFDRLLENATSQMLLEPSWATNLEICDSIRQKDVTPKYAMATIRKKIKDPNPHVCKYALVVLETCVKNCGQGFHEELVSHDLMDDMRSLAQTGSAPVKEQILQMLQAWNHAFRNKTQFQPILATYNLMKMEGYQFPMLSDSDAMFSADEAPSWKDGDVCHMCRVKFATFTRQHHCRACGEAFCAKCSSKTSIIPKFGVERKERVCDPCYDEINPNDGNMEASGGGESSKGIDEKTGLPLEYLNSALAKEAQTKPKLSDTEAKAQEEEELQLAYALSLSQEEANKTSTSKNWSQPQEPIYAVPKKSEPKKSESKPKTAFSGVCEKAFKYCMVGLSKDVVFHRQKSESLKALNDDNSSELSKYLDRSYWEKKSAESATRQPSAPLAVEQPQAMYAQAVVDEDEEEEEESDDGGEEKFDSSAFVETMEKSILMFIDRMQQVQMKGKHIAMDSTIQSLFQSLSAMHPQLIKLIEDEEDSKAKYEAMLEKLSIIREARESLNDMRAQHEEKVRQQELEQEMLRRMQMEQKLELMRQQKQEYLEYQRSLQMQRQQELDIYQQDKLRQKQMQTGFDAYGNPQFVPASVYAPVPPTENSYDVSTRPPQYSSLNNSFTDAPPPSYQNVSNTYQEPTNKPPTQRWQEETQAPQYSQQQPPQPVAPYAQQGAQASPMHVGAQQQQTLPPQQLAGQQNIPSQQYPAQPNSQQLPAGGKQFPPHIQMQQQGQVTSNPQYQQLPGSQTQQQVVSKQSYPPNQIPQNQVTPQPQQSSQAVKHQYPSQQLMSPPQQANQQFSPQHHQPPNQQQQQPQPNQYQQQPVASQQQQEPGYQNSQPTSQQNYYSQQPQQQQIQQQLPPQQQPQQENQQQQQPQFNQYTQQIQGGPPQQMQGGPPPQQMQGAPPQQIHGAPQQQMQGASPQQRQGAPPQQMQGTQPQQMQGPPPQQMQGAHPQQMQGAHLQQMQGAPPQQMQGGPPQQMHGGHPQQIQGGPPQLHGGYPGGQGMMQQQQQPTVELTANMKDLQLISFD